MLTLYRITLFLLEVAISDLFLFRLTTSKMFFKHFRSLVEALYPALTATWVLGTINELTAALIAHWTVLLDWHLNIQSHRTLTMKLWGLLLKDYAIWSLFYEVFCFPRYSESLIFFFLIKLFCAELRILYEYEVPFFRKLQTMHSSCMKKYYWYGSKVCFSACQTRS